MSSFARPAVLLKTENRGTRGERVSKAVVFCFVVVFFFAFVSATHASSARFCAFWCPCSSQVVVTKKGDTWRLDSRTGCWVLVKRATPPDPPAFRVSGLVVSRLR